MMDCTDILSNQIQWCFRSFLTPNLKMKSALKRNSKADVAVSPIANGCHDDSLLPDTRKIAVWEMLRCKCKIKEIRGIIVLS